MAASDEALHALAQHLVGETDGEPPDVQLGPNGLYLVSGTGPRPSVVGGPEPPQISLAEAQAQLPRATPPATDAFAKAATIGASRVGERYATPSLAEILAMPNPLIGLAEYLVGAGRPRSVAAQDPQGIEAWSQGAGAVPGLLMGSVEKVPEEVASTLGNLAKSGAQGLRERFTNAITQYLKPGDAPFYSRLDEAAQGLPTQTFAPKIAGLVQKGQASADELAARHVPELLAQAGTKPITKEAVQDYLAANPPPRLAVKTLGGSAPASAPLQIQADYLFARQPSTTNEWLELSKHLEGQAQRARGAERAYYFQLSEEATQHAEAVDLGRGDYSGDAKFERYQLPGGTNYRETLITLPTKQQGLGDLLPGESLVDALNRQQAANPVFKSAHFDEPNILVHTRSNTRDLPGVGPGTFLEEVQSDWHQKGKAQGYQAPAADVQVMKDRLDAIRAQKDALAQARDPRTNQMLDEPQWHALSREQEAINDRYNRTVNDAVPNAPFKETWPDLALKHHLAEAAVDPNTHWLGFTSGETQAARYDLSKQISRVEFHPVALDARLSQGFGETKGRLSAWDLNGSKVLEEYVPPTKLPDYIGKEAADKLLKTTPSGGDRPFYSLNGLDLKIGGEGMHAFYDNLLPKRLEKIVKPFGGTVEQMPLGGRSVSQIDAAMDALYQELQTSSMRTTEYNRRLKVLQAERNASNDGTKAWVAKLTPEMKARILKSGLALMTGLGAAGAALVAPRRGAGGDGNAE